MADPLAELLEALRDEEKIESEVLPLVQTMGRNGMRIIYTPKNYIRFSDTPGAPEMLHDILKEAIRRGFTQVVAVLLRPGITIHHDWKGSLLIDAIVEGHVKIVNLLIQAGANLEYRVANDGTLLNIAVEGLLQTLRGPTSHQYSSFVAIIRALLVAGAPRDIPRVQFIAPGYMRNGEFEVNDRIEHIESLDISELIDMYTDLEPNTARAIVALWDVLLPPVQQNILDTLRAMQHISERRYFRAIGLLRELPLPEDMQANVIFRNRNQGSEERSFMRQPRIPVEFTPGTGGLSLGEELKILTSGPRYRHRRKMALGNNNSEEERQAFLASNSSGLPPNVNVKAELAQAADDNAANNLANAALAARGAVGRRRRTRKSYRRGHKQTFRKNKL